MNTSMVRRGEIYWVENGTMGIVGAEKPSRPGLVIAPPISTSEYDWIKIVFLTRTPKYNEDTNVEISNTSNGKCIGSVALCGAVHTIERSRILPENYVTRLENDDMERIDRALLRAVGLEHLLEEKEEQGEDPRRTGVTQSKAPEKPQTDYREIVRLQTEAEFYKAKYNEILDKILSR